MELPKTSHVQERVSPKFPKSVWMSSSEDHVNVKTKQPKHRKNFLGSKNKDNLEKRGLSWVSQVILFKLFYSSSSKSYLKISTV